MIEGKEIVVPKCGGCGGRLTIMRYRAADGDLMFLPRPYADENGTPHRAPLVIIEGNGPMQARSLFVCPTCDRLDLIPRAQRS